MQNSKQNWGSDLEIKSYPQYELPDPSTQHYTPGFQLQVVKEPAIVHGRIKFMGRHVDWLQVKPGQKWVFTCPRGKDYYTAIGKMVASWMYSLPVVPKKRGSESVSLKMQRESQW